MNKKEMNKLSRENTKLSKELGYVSTKQLIKENPQIFSKFGSIQWQNEMIANIEEKKKSNIELNDYERTFIKVQEEHNSRIFEGC